MTLRTIDNLFPMFSVQEARKSTFWFLDSNISPYIFHLFHDSIPRHLERSKKVIKNFTKEESSWATNNFDIDIYIFVFEK
jgi:hypothetical protein